MPDWLWVVMFLSIGILLFLLEIFTPGFGLSGLSGLIAISIGIYLSFKKLNLFWGIISVLAGLSLVIVTIKVFPKSRFWKKIRLDLEESKKEGFITSEDLERFIDKEGVTLSVLRPTGLALIEGKRLPVQSEGIFILKGKEIIVIRREGNMLVVKEKMKGG